MVDTSAETRIREFFCALYRAWGRQHWWPADSPFEVIAGAILTQNTAWTNVERAMDKLRSAGVLSLNGIRATPPPELESLIRSAGFFRQKAQRLKTFVAYVDERYEGSLAGFLARPTQELRTELLSLKGIGPETADSILLYAGQHEVFVADAYARRILERHQVLSRAASYEEVRRLFEHALTSEFAKSILSETRKIEGSVSHKPPGAHHAPSTMSTSPRSQRAQLLNEMHGLIVGVGKNFCQSRRVRCDKCPLSIFLDEPIQLPELPRRTKLR